MRLGVLSVLLAAAAAAQSPMPYEKKESPAPPAASTAAVTASTAAVAASSSTAPTDEVAGRGFKVGGGAPKGKLSRPIHAVIHKDAVDWEPLSLREGGLPGSADNAVSLRVVEIKGRMKGDSSKARSAARLHKGKKDSVWLVISVYPKSLEGKRTHFELRLRVFEGFVEEAEAAAVTVTDRRRPPAGKLLDSFDLREQAIEYQSERPGSGQLVVAELDPRPGASSVNSGRLEKAEFADSDLGFVNLSWSAKGVRAAGK
ncbi:MAG: hypothetical protein PHS14_11375 [Elusimicrobia bacterium]|nr:hypothetical protein [Elusimicrobiota bacterium]